MIQLSGHHLIDSVCRIFPWSIRTDSPSPTPHFFVVAITLQSLLPAQLIICIDIISSIRVYLFSPCTVNV